MAEESGPGWGTLPPEEIEARRRAWERRSARRRARDMGPHRCDECGRIKPDVRLRLDPWVLAVSSEEEERHLCAACEAVRQGDV